MKMNRINLIIAIVFAIFGVAILLLTPVFVTAVSSSYNGMVPTSFPYFVGWFTIAMSIGLATESILSIRRGEDEEKIEHRDPQKEKRVILIFALLIVYTALCGVLGFFLASALFVCTFLRLLGVKKWQQYVLAVALVFIIFYAFRYMLYIHLPRIGVWII